jgi:transposase
VTIFVAALSFSDYFYIEGMTCCDISNWLRVNNNAIAYFGGITQTVTPDNCKVAVTENKDWINPSVNKDFPGLGRAQRHRHHACQGQKAPLEAEC